MSRFSQPTRFYQQQNLDEAAVAVKNVQVDVLPESLKPVYITIRDATGVAGSEIRNSRRQMNHPVGKAAETPTVRREVRMAQDMTTPDLWRRKL